MTLSVWPASPLPAGLEQTFFWAFDEAYYDSGASQAMTPYTRPLYRYSIPFENFSKSKRDTILNFWNQRARAGNEPFLIKDPYDYQVSSVLAVGSAVQVGDQYALRPAWVANSAPRRTYGVTWSPELSIYVAVGGIGTGQRAMTSPDGVTWTARSTPADQTWFNVAWSPALDLFAAVSYDGTGQRVMTSPDGITWTIRSTPIDHQWVSITWANDLALFVAVSQVGTGKNVMTSPDGITWTARSTPANYAWSSITWSEELGLLVALAFTGTGQRAMTSPDGITWTLRTTPNISWRGVAWSPALSLFAAVADTGTGQRVMTSPDGITWTARSTPADISWYSIAWSPQLGLFVAVAYAGIGPRSMVSSNGINWNIFSTANDYDWSSIVWSPDRLEFLTVAYNNVTQPTMTLGTSMTNYPVTSIFLYDTNSFFIRVDTAAMSIVSALSGTLAAGSQYAYNVDSGILTINQKTVNDVWGLRNAEYWRKVKFDGQFAASSKLWEIYMANIRLREVY